MRKTVLRSLLVVAIMVMGLPVAVKGEGMGNIRVLVAYYSKSGNTEKMAECIARYTGGELLRIEPEVAYPEDEQAFVKRAKEEMAGGGVIAIKPNGVDLAQYDVVFVGSPVWFNDWAAPAVTFVQNPMLEGKRVIPFMTSGKRVENVTDQLCKKYISAKPERGLCLEEERVKREVNMGRLVKDWVVNLLGMKSCGEYTTLNVVMGAKRMLAQYPKMRLTDAYKSFYQDYFGPGHIIASKSQATKNIKEELKTVTGESIGRESCGALGRYVRVDLNEVKSGEMKMGDYVDMLMKSVQTTADTTEWVRCWNFILSELKHSGVEFVEMDKDVQFIQGRIRAGKYEMHHSKEFNEIYHPHYRIIKRELLKP